MGHSSERPVEVSERIGEVLGSMKAGEGLALWFPDGPTKLMSDVMVQRAGSQRTDNREGAFTWFVK